MKVLFVDRLQVRMKLKGGKGYDGRTESEGWMASPATVFISEPNGGRGGKGGKGGRGEKGERVRSPVAVRAREGTADCLL